MITQSMPEITLRGSAYERGLYYGQTAKENIGQTLSKWHAHLGSFNSGESSSTSVSEHENYLKAFLDDTDYLTAIKKWTPDLLEEVKGIAEGAGQPYTSILGLQLMDEEWLFGLRKKMDKPINKCTAFGIEQSSKGMSYAGQNMDIGAWSEGSQTLLRLSATSTAPEILVFTIAGSIGLNGINACGLGITCNTLAQLHNSKEGLPVAFIVRAILGQPSIGDAEAFLRTIPHASGQNYILSSADDIRCFECSAGKVERYQSENNSGRIFHTNHPLVNHGFNTLLPPEQQKSPNSIARLQSIKHRLGANSDINFETIKVALSAHDDQENPVSRHCADSNSAIGYTAGSCIYEFAVPPLLHLASGPPCQTDYLTFEFSGSGMEP